MEPPDPSFVDEFNVSQGYAVLVFDVRRAAVSLISLQICIHFYYYLYLNSIEYFLLPLVKGPVKYFGTNCH